MTEHPLDRPVWASLTTQHRDFSIGTSHALRFQPDVSPFIAVCDDSPRSQRDLGDLLEEETPLILAQAGNPMLPSNAKILAHRMAVQMVFQGPLPQASDERPLEILSARDAPAMQELAALTNPGPFAQRTHELGRFWGVKREGVLQAMAGERLKSPGFVEVSGVCTHPAAQGQGYGRALCIRVCNAILDDGSTPFLHVFDDNTRAITLYESLGFTPRCKINVVMLSSNLERSL